MFRLDACDLDLRLRQSIGLLSADYWRSSRGLCQPFAVEVEIHEDEHRARHVAIFGNGAIPNPFEGGDASDALKSCLWCRRGDALKGGIFGIIMPRHYSKIGGLGSAGVIPVASGKLYQSRSWQRVKQILGSDRQGLCQLHDVFQSDVSLAALHAAHIVPMQSRSLRKLLLRIAALLSQGSQRRSEGGLNRRFRHSLMLGV